MQKKFVVDSSGYDEAFGLALEFIHERLAALKLKGKESYRVELMCEESLGRLLEHADFTKAGAFSVNVRKFLGDVFVDLTVPGEEFDFSSSIELSSMSYADDEDFSPADESVIQNLLLSSFADNLKYGHSRNYNTITVKAFQSLSSVLYKLFIALFLAVVCGLATKTFLPESVYMPINDNVLVAIRTLFMNGLKMCAVPIVFFSIAASMSNMGNVSGLKRTSVVFMVISLIMNIIAIAGGYGIVMLFGIGKHAGLHAASISSGAAGSVSFAENFINLIPENIIRPFLESNMLQLMLIAFIAGRAIASVKAEIITKSINEFNSVFMKITGYLVKFIPVVIFCSITSVMITTGLNTIISMLGLLLTIWGGFLLLHVLYCIGLKFYAGLNPAPFYRKSMSAIITGFTTCSSSASLPDMMKSAEALGVPQKISYFSLPLGLSINKIANSLSLSVYILTCANMYGVSMSMSSLVSLGISIIIINIAASGMAGGGIVTLSILLSQAGLPLEFIPLVMSIDTLNDMMNTPTSCTGNIVCTVLTASKDKLLDVEQYNKR